MTGNLKTETTDVPKQLHEAFAPLLLAFQYVDQLGSDPWEFAVEIDQLTALGVAPNDIRWMVRRGLVTHRREVTLDGENGRQFQSAGDLTYCERSCFVLTESGSDLAQLLHHTNGIPPESDTHRTVRSRLRNGYAMNGEPSLSPVPIWDTERRELWFDGDVVKHFKWVAVNQQAVLCAFEEDGWPARIDDPLPPHEEQDSKRRLADTIKCLNRKQCHAVLHFRGDGTGEGVIWEFVEVSKNNQ